MFEDKIKKIGIDGNLLCGKKTGMGMVVYNILLRLKPPDNIQTILYIPDKLEKEYMHQLEKNGIKIMVIGKRNYIIWEQIILPLQVWKDKIDLLWCPYNTAPLFLFCNSVITIHDTIYMTLKLKDIPSIYKKMGVLYRRCVVPIVAKKAKRIVTVSNFSKEDIIRYIPGINRKIDVIYNGIENKVITGEEKSNYLQEIGIVKPYILGFGSLEHRKNSMGLIKAYELLDERVKSKLQLVLFGFRKYKQSSEWKYIKGNNLEDKIVVLEYVSEYEKKILYSNCCIFVFPTLSEEFGIPVLEAFVARVPVITSNVTSLPEIAGDAAVLIDPNNLEELKNAIEDLYSNERKKAELVRKGVIQSSKFSWDTTSQKMFDVLNNVN